MRSIDPRHLLQFHEIIRTGSFTKAAVTLGLTQPALTRNMKLMEGRLGFEIMIRSRQGVIPTALGARVLEEAGAEEYPLPRVCLSLADEGSIGRH